MSKGRGGHANKGAYFTGYGGSHSPRALRRPYSARAGSVPPSLADTRLLISGPTDTSLIWTLSAINQPEEHSTPELLTRRTLSERCGICLGRSTGRAPSSLSPRHPALQNTVVELGQKLRRSQRSGWRPSPLTRDMAQRLNWRAHWSSHVGRDR